MALRRLEAAGAVRDAPDEGQLLLRLALSRPKEALEQAEQVQGGRPGATQSSYALQAMSVAHRELGHGSTAVRLARRALRAAQRCGQPARVADVQATLGATLALVGRNRDALRALDGAVRCARGLDAARILVRRGGVLQILGRHDDALDDLRTALPALRSAGDIVYEARALGWRGLVYDERGDRARSDRDLARSEALMGAAGQRLESARARHNRGHMAFRSGDLPAALRHFDAAERMYGEVGTADAELELDRCRVLLAAGMPEDARRHASRAAQVLGENSALAHTRAEALLTAASCGLAAGDLLDARNDAEAATRLFRAQQRERWTRKAQRCVLAARWLAGETTPATLRLAVHVADRLESMRDQEATDAHLLAGRIALRLGRGRTAEAHLAAAAHARRRGPAIGRATGWLAKALLAEAAGEPRTMLSACRRGLDLLDEHRLTLGATEMQARASVHGAELAGLATRHAARAGDAQRLLLWSERWRATALSSAPVRPPDDDELAAELAVLRGVTRRIGEVRAEGRSSSDLEHQQSRIEASVRGRMLRRSGTTTRTRATVDVRRIRAALPGEALLVELVEVDGTLYVVTVGPRGTRLQMVGDATTAIEELEFARFGLRQAATTSSPAGLRLAMSSLETAGRLLQQALLGPAVDQLGDAGGDVVIVPSGRLHAVPWSLLPALRGRCVTVAPSVASWLRATATPRPRRNRVALVAGPDLHTEGAEVQAAAALHPSARLLTGPAATADDVLAALDGASLAHVAAHGAFRADNPLFSSLRMADGPLTVHDLERLQRPPYRLVLSSCDSGLGAVAGADELLGLAGALIGLGTAGLLASVVPVNDRATVPLMVAVHERLRAGDTLGRALHAARSVGADDPLLRATGWSFIALGAA